ncbi:MAG TPA: lysylphosphatidylglycerol synthase transmembrane domain-containing protein, partial [Lamprocystis sp. (in: g-proteobacteria)]|nr:lysylphosphatidylglycerol synthase transmembrane domain-containing protein [Lamprocystis sp. (in: g-proteobacteria)]
MCLGRPRDWLIGAAFLAALVAVVHYTVGWGPLLAPWLAFPPLLIAWLFLLTALSYVMRAVRVYDWFSPRLSGHFPVVLRLSVLHNTANNLLPMRTGEMVFPWLMRRYFGYGLLDATAVLLWIRILDMHFLGLIGILILELRDPAWFWWVAGLAWVGGLSLLALISRAGAAPWLAGGGRTRRIARAVAAAAPRDPWLIVRVYLWTAGTWTLKFIAFASVLDHFIPVAFWRVMAGVMGAELSSVLPFHGIAGSGSYELAAVAALVPLGVDPQMALSGAVNLHLFVLGTTLILGGLAFLLPKAKGPHQMAAVG